MGCVSFDERPITATSASFSCGYIVRSMVRLARFLIVYDLELCLSCSYLQLF